MKIYVVIRSRPKFPKSPEFEGIFSTRRAAQEACETWEHFFVPFTLNRRLPRRRTNCLDWFHPQSGKVLRAGTRHWIPAR